MAVNKELKDAIEFIKYKFKLTQSDIADDLGIQKTYLSDMINGRVPFTDNIKEKVYELYSYTFDGFDTNKPKIQILNGGGDAIPIENEEQYQRAIESGLKMLPEIDFVFNAGQTTLVSNSHAILRYWYLPDCEDCEAVATMIGNSMLPTYPPGCNLAFKRYGYDVEYPNTIAFGNVFGVVVEDKITGEWIGHVKILRRHKDSDLAKRYWIAQSLNPDFDDFDIELKQVRSLWILKQYIVTNT